MANEKGPILTALEEVRKNPTLASEALAKRAARNTRPAAPVEGLETVGYQYWREQTQQWIPTSFPGEHEKEGKTTRPLVTRSNAESIIAAKDAEIKKMWARHGGYERSLSQSRDKCEKLEADNAALTARVKELEQINANLMGDDEDKPRYTTKRLKHEIARATEALEAKLAAVEKALERADEALQLDATASGHTYVKIALGEVRS